MRLQITIRKRNGDSGSSAIRDALPFLHGMADANSERDLRTEERDAMRVFLTARDLLSVCDMAEHLLTMDEVDWITIVDCQSTYAPLLSRYNDLPDGIEIVLCSNLGPRAAWHVCRELMREGPYIVSDGDLDISSFPKDTITRIRERLMSQSHLVKVGAALQIWDLPKTELAEKARNHEAQFWSRPVASGVYSADIDTTFAMYRDPDWGGYGPAERCSFATAKHLAWHLEAGKIPDDWQHYLKRVDRGAGTHWSQYIAEKGVA